MELPVVLQRRKTFWVNFPCFRARIEKWAAPPSLSALLPTSLLFSACAWRRAQQPRPEREQADIWKLPTLSGAISQSRVWYLLLYCSLPLSLARTPNCLCNWFHQDWVFLLKRYVRVCRCPSKHKNAVKAIFCSCIDFLALPKITNYKSDVT